MDLIPFCDLVIHMHPKVEEHWLRMCVVFFLADNNIKSLSGVKSLYVGEIGGKGQSKHCRGENAQHTVIKVFSDYKRTLVSSIYFIFWI